MIFVTPTTDEDHVSNAHKLSHLQLTLVSIRHRPNVEILKHNSMASEDLIQKYDVPVPRYTSYPTVPFWDQEEFDSQKWMQVVKRAFGESNSKKGISLYIHLPYCESLCTYCGCNKRITKNHLVEEGYIQTILAEWRLYKQHFDEKPVIRELHLGGGTPTFFSPDNLYKLITLLLDGCELHPQYEMSFEGHPNNTTFEHLKILFELGFERMSLGIQDFDEKVQRTINRIQPAVKVEEVTNAAREVGYKSINFDLIYGLPFQTKASIENTMDVIRPMRPDRIAFYSYAHVPWKSPAQRGYSEKDLPGNTAKRALYELGKRKLTEFGYHDIGMDHFALPGDDLYKAARNRSLHRNFMGYTICNTDLLIGLGASSISDAKYAYAQNLKKVEDYKEAISSGSLATFKGHFLSDLDLRIKDFILEVLCQGEADWDLLMTNSFSGGTLPELETMEKEGLLATSNTGVKVTQLGKAFVRNICSVFDQKLQNKKSNNSNVFSKAI